MVDEVKAAQENFPIWLCAWHIVDGVLIRCDPSVCTNHGKFQLLSKKWAKGTNCSWLFQAMEIGSKTPKSGRICQGVIAVFALIVKYGGTRPFCHIFNLVMHSLSIYGPLLSVVQ